MSTAHTAFNVTDLYTGRSFTYVPGDGPSLAALFPEATDSTTYALETVTDALDAGYLPDTDTLAFLTLVITPEDGTDVCGGVL
ncbi:MULTISPECIES: hypothetical protein [Brevibacterium]|uniref:Uncharacterized protein n=2 Tax=Brevibacterium TaxID=1696 RepID=A0A3T0DEE6_BREAU|nr:hypothetical protein [Brevibacterium aurantiacum]AZL05689.1 hypothetical protein CXR24_08900 [Brevibacterium aurantiacum]AZL12899.1 hypothetical protein CXR25_08840 [Brevibacterium aurantiacum]AZT93366.1 hypothetical protein CXR23_09600 [Brevibacterium aurantiacum]RCS90864.1 hypothetical protein CIK63_07215 [Brevibacterium aurantiacum]TGD38959.1 hypothetical protein EB834_08290 [Brevibacterium aurantiacum]